MEHVQKNRGTQTDERRVSSKKPTTALRCVQLIPTTPTTFQWIKKTQIKSLQNTIYYNTNYSNNSKNLNVSATCVRGKL